MNNPRLFQSIALACIKAYQCHLSPLKGYSCAFRVLTGRDSCSAYGYRVIARHGLPTGLRLLKRRMRACSTQCRHHQCEQDLHPARRRPHAQAGFCDCDIPGDVTDLCDCCDPCDIIRGAKSVWRNFRCGRPPLRKTGTRNADAER